MGLFNNPVGINIANLHTFPALVSNSTLSNEVYSSLLNGDLRYLTPTLPPPLLPNGEINPNGDPNFYGAGGINDPKTATHGIYSVTTLTPTNL